MGSLIINVPFRLAFGPRNSLTLCGDLRSQRRSDCPDKSRKALSAAATLRVPPKILRKMGQEGQLPCLGSATGVAFVPLREACLIIGIVIVVIKRDTARKGGVYRVCSEFQLHVFVSARAPENVSIFGLSNVGAAHTGNIASNRPILLRSATFILEESNLILT